MITLWTLQRIKGWIYVELNKDEDKEILRKYDVVLDKGRVNIILSIARWIRAHHEIRIPT